MKKLLLILVGLLTVMTTWAGEYTFDSQTGTLTLVSGEFNMNNKWGSDVSPTAVKKVVATNQVSFTSDCTELFCGFSNCTSMDLNSVNTYDTNSSGGPAYCMKRMFKDCSKLTSLNLSSWNTSYSRFADGMFQNCSNLTSLNISSWNTNSFISINNMFEGCSKLTSPDVSDWNVSNVIYMTSMFKGCSELTSLDLSGWDVQRIVFMDSLFYDCSKLTTLDVTGWKRGTNANMSNMFAHCTSLTSLDLSSWKVQSSSIYMSSMFAYCTNLTSLDLLGWTLNNANLSNMFAHCTNLSSLDLSGWTIGNSNFENMFAHCTNLSSLNLSNWRVYSSNNMTNMFLSCTSLTSVNLTDWDANSGSFLNSMFSGCSNLTTIYASTNWNAESLTASNTSNMFESCTKLVGGCGTTYDSNYTDKTYARIDRGTSNPGYFTGVFRLFLPSTVTASSPFFTHNYNDYYLGGSTVTLTYNGSVPEGKTLMFLVSGNGTLFYTRGNTFQMPIYNASISVIFVDSPTEVTVGDITFNMIKVEGNDDIPTFYIGECEVTEALWQEVMGSNPSSYQGNLEDNRPVENISWNDCQEFLAKLRQKTRLDFRLPTSAEWLFAASGGKYSNGFTYSGSNTIGDVAWYASNCEQKQTVGTKDSNELGIYDMSGNVYEIIQEATRAYGGGWHSPAKNCKVNYGWPINEEYTDNDTGLRLAITNFYEIPETESVTVGDITFNMVKVEGNDDISTFYIGECEVTEALWQEVMGSNPSSYQGNLEDNLPVEMVTWNDCQEFLAQLKEMTNLDFRLPTSAEWVFAASGGNKTHGYTFSGSNTIGDVAWYKDNCSQKMTVGTKDPNELGIYDMSGNVYEIIQEATGVYGGGWHAQASSCNVNYYWPTDETFADDDTGFRLALTRFGSTSTPGDVDGDGNVTAGDVTALYNWILNGNDSLIVNGDQDGDGFITSSDVTFVYNILLGN